MRRSLFLLVAGSLGTLALVTCSGGSGNGTEPPPASVSSVQVTPSTADLTVGQTTQLSATTKDASGNTLSGRTVNWSSSDQGIASVSGSGLVSAVGPGQATITATSEGKSGSATIDVALASFQPTSSTSIQGNLRFARATIPAGVTVTAGGALTLTAEDSLTIRGNLVGDCFAVTLIAQTVVIEGDVRNTCSNDPEDPPVLRIVSGSTIEIGPGEFESSGDIVITNDSTLLDSDFPAALIGTISTFAVPANAVIRGNCSFTGRNFSRPFRNVGTSGQFGGTGRNGRTLRVDCAGDLLLAGGAKLQAQHGGKGGMGIHTHTQNATSKGGDGGQGGEVRIRTLGKVVISGVGNEIITGDGGMGGDSESNGDVNPAIARAASATATGGNGGPPGLATILAGGGVVPATGGGAFSIVIGTSGEGGGAEANAADGLDADQRPGPAQAGGNATATGGTGGSSPDKKLVANGAVSLIPAVVGGTGGTGGMATAKGGNGGDGDELDPDGAEGGQMEPLGGNGGDSNVRNFAGSLVSDGGMSGGALALNGWGGNGWNDCAPGQPRKPGGDGGRAGDVVGFGGFGGAGKQPGMQVRVFAKDASHGGKGGDGDLPGAGGSAGLDLMIPQKGDTNSFVDGKGGNPCGTPPAGAYAGTYHYVLDQVFQNGVCPALAAHSEGDVQVTETLTNSQGIALPILPIVIFHSDNHVAGQVNMDGSYEGSGSGPVSIGGQTFSVIEMIRGIFQVQSGTVVLNTVAELELFIFGTNVTCNSKWRGNWTRTGPPANGTS